MYYIKKQNFKKSYPYNKKVTAIIHMLGIIVLLELLMMSSMVLENVQAETITLEGRVEGKETLPFFVPFEGRIENVYIHHQNKK